MTAEIANCILGWAALSVSLLWAAYFVWRFYEYYTYTRYYRGWRKWKAKEIASKDTDRVLAAFEEAVMLDPSLLPRKELVRAYRRRWEEVRQRNRHQDASTG